MLFSLNVNMNAIVINGLAKISFRKRTTPRANHTEGFVENNDKFEATGLLSVAPGRGNKPASAETEDTLLH